MAKVYKECYPEFMLDLLELQINVNDFDLHQQFILVCNLKKDSLTKKKLLNQNQKESFTFEELDAIVSRI